MPWYALTCRCPIEISRWGRSEQESGISLYRDPTASRTLTPSREHSRQRGTHPRYRPNLLFSSLLLHHEEVRREILIGCRCRTTQKPAMPFMFIQPVRHSSSAPSRARHQFCIAPVKSVEIPFFSFVVSLIMKCDKCNSCCRNPFPSHPCCDTDSKFRPLKKYIIHQHAELAALPAVLSSFHKCRFCDTSIIASPTIITWLDSS